jgi:PAS domain S-box-containing protein
LILVDQLTVLLVESSEADAIQIGEFLSDSKDYKFDIFHTTSLKDAESIIREERIDITLVNLFLPDSYGIHTFNNLFHKFPKMPFIVLTELDDNYIGMNAVKQGAQDYIVKSELSISNLDRSISYAIERKHTEDELRKSEEKYRELFMRSKDAIYMSTTEGEFIDINPAGLALFGYNREDLNSVMVKDLYVNKADRDKLMFTLREEGEVSDYEVSLVKKDGEVLNCILNTIVVRNQEGQVIGFQGIIKDITSRKRAEKALIESLRDLDFANRELQDLNANLEVKVDERTSELMQEKEKVEQQHKEIKESINYAKRIQASILPPIKKVKDSLRDSFIYYEPKDIVSGDFYWFERTNGKSLFAVVDCTGHGVPGAFMSIIGYTQLNEIVSDQRITDPGKILKELDKRVRTALNQRKDNDRNSKDGMELGVLTIHHDQQRIEFAGAMRPLFYVRDGELQVIKGDKFSIGGFSRHKKNFNTHSINIRKGDCFYLFSDGYPDQFGGPLGKKFMTKHVGEMLRKIAHLPMAEQGRIVKSTIADWMKDEEQIDDILMTGMRF